MFFTLFWYQVRGGGGGGSQGIGTQPAYAVFHSGQVKNGSHLAEVVRSKPGRQAYIGENATYPPFWAYSRTLPQGVELLV